MADATTVKEITDRLETGVRELFESDKYAAYLQTMSRFHKYSTRNTLLIHMQYPQATRVAGFASWKQKFNRHVKKGEHGIKIFAPVPFVIKEELEKIDPVTKQPILDENGQPIIEEHIKAQSARFKIVNVFDILQTAGEPLPELAETLTGDVERYDLFMDALRAVSPLPIVFEDLPADTDGRCIFGDRIAIRSGMSEIQTVAAVIHEITHAKLHDIEVLRLADPSAQANEVRFTKDRRTEETEAESVAFATCAYYNVDTGANSFGYIAEWSRGRELKELNASLDIIRKTAAELIDSIDEQYRVLAKERGISLSDNASKKAFDESRDIVAEQAAAFMESSGGYNRIIEAEARYACEQCVKRVVDDLMVYKGGEQYMRLYDQYVGDAGFKKKLNDFVFIKAYIEPMKAMGRLPEEKEAEEPKTVLLQQETTRKHADNLSARIDEIASAIRDGQVIDVSYDGRKYDGKNPVIELFKQYGVELPSRTQGWVNSGLAEITQDNYRFFTGKNRNDSSAFGEYLLKLRDAIKQQQTRQQQTANSERMPKELDMSMPDPLTSIADMNAYGYSHDYMLPLSSGRAVELFDTGHPVYLLYPDNTEAMAIDRDEVRLHKGLCGIEEEDWKASPVNRAQTAIANNREDESKQETQQSIVDDERQTTQRVEAKQQQASTAAKQPPAIHRKPLSKQKPSILSRLDAAKRQVERNRQNISATNKEDRSHTDV